MTDEKKQAPEADEKKSSTSENWPEEAVQDILDYIEEQGIYIRE